MEGQEPRATAGLSTGRTRSCPSAIDPIPPQVIPLVFSFSLPRRIVMKVAISGRRQRDPAWQKRQSLSPPMVRVVAHYLAHHAPLCPLRPRFYIALGCKGGAQESTWGTTPRLATT